MAERELPRDVSVEQVLAEFAQEIERTELYGADDVVRAITRMAALSVVARVDRWEGLHRSHVTAAQVAMAEGIVIGALAWQESIEIAHTKAVELAAREEH